MSDGARVTGIVDWSGFLVADPLFDVAATIVLFSIAAKHRIADGEFPPADVDQIVHEYLGGYEARRSLDRTNLPYYLGLRSLTCLLQAADGVEGWQHPGMIADLEASVSKVSNIKVALPPTQQPTATAKPHIEATPRRQPGNRHHHPPSPP